MPMSPAGSTLVAGHAPSDPRSSVALDRLRTEMVELMRLMPGLSLAPAAAPQHGLGAGPGSGRGAGWSEGSGSDSGAGVVFSTI